MNGVVEHVNKTRIVNPKLEEAEVITAIVSGLCTAAFAAFCCTMYDLEQRNR